MSTILDSLKKSSNKRDDQEKNSIDNFNFSHSKKPSKSGLIMILFLIIVTAVILYFGYQYINQDNTSQKITNNDGSTPKQEQQNKEKNVSESMQTKDIDPNKLQKPNSEAVKQQLAETKVKTQQSEPTTRTVVQNEDGDLAELEPTSKPTTTKQSTAEKPMIQLSLQDETNNQQNSEQPEVKKQEHLYVYQLPFSVRKEMPKFKLNIHIYDENPESRVAVINGVKFAVDDLIDEQVLIKEIVREGVLLEFTGHVFLLPIL